MNTTLICYADHQMKTSQELCVTSAIEKGKINLYWTYDPELIQCDDGFYLRNQKILEEQQRGGGYGHWLWKPYMCLDALQRLHNGNDSEELQYLIYADSGIEFIASISPIIEQMQKTGQNIFLFGNGHTHLFWCKKKVLQSMLPNWAYMPQLQEEEQVQASVIVFKVCQESIDFVREWLAWCEIPGFIDNSDNVGLTNYYRDHRNDQAILTNLAILKGIQRHWWPVQYGKHTRGKYAADLYGQLFYHHRYRETDWENNKMSIQQFMLQPKN
jgi:hypothetical protein